MKPLNISLYTPCLVLLHQSWFRIARNTELVLFLIYIEANKTINVVWIKKQMFNSKQVHLPLLRVLLLFS